MQNSEFLRLEHATDYKNQSFEYGLNNVFLNVRYNENVGVFCDYHKSSSDVALLISGLRVISKFQIYINGKRIDHWDEGEAKKFGIHYLGSNFDSFLANQDVAFNIYYQDPFPSLFIRKSKMLKDCQILFDAFSIDLSPQLPIKSLEKWEHFIIRVLHEYISGTKLLIVDNICSSFSERQLKKIRIILDQLREKGMCFLFCDDDPIALYYLSNRIFTIVSGVVLSVDDTDHIEASQLSKKVFKDTFKAISGNLVNRSIPYLDLIQTSRYTKKKVITLSTGELSALIIRSYSRLKELEDLFRGNPSEEFSVYLYKSANHNSSFHIGIISEEGGLFPNMSVFENMSISLEKEYSNIMAIQNKRVRSAYFDRVPEHLRKQITSITHYDPELRILANRKLIELARRLVQQANILIFINPFYRLDSISSRQLYETISKLRETGITILFLMNDPPSDSKIFDQIITLI